MTEPDTLAGLRPRWTAFVCGMASYIDAGIIVTWSVVLVIYQQVTGLTPAEFGILSGLLTFGIAVGALVGGRLGDRFGRRPVFAVTMAIVAIAVVGMMFSTSFPAYVICTAAVGLAAGADLPVSLATVAEAASDKSRGKLLGFSQVLWLVGAVVPGIAASVVGNMGQLGAQILLVHLAIVSVLVLVARMTIPESRVWLAARRASQDHAVVDVPARVGIATLLRGQYLVPFVALLVFYGLGNAVFNVLGQFGSYLLVNVADMDVAGASLLGLATLPIVLVAALLFMKAADGKNRFRYFTLGAIAFTAAQLIPILFGFSTVTYLASTVVTSFAAAFAGEAIMKVWTQRSFPSLVRTTAQGVIIAVGRFTAAGLAVVAPLLIAVDVRLLYAVTLVLAGVSGAVAWLAFRRRDSHDEFAVEAARLETEAGARDLEPLT